MRRTTILAKMLVAVLLLSLLSIGVLGYVSFRKIEEQERICKETIEGALRAMGEDLILKKATSAATQLEVYFKGHPGYVLADLREDPTFREIAVQPVGQTGYTAVHELGTGINRFHTNPKVEDFDLHNLATKLPGFWKILEPHLAGTVTKGYYEWQDADGKIRDKYMVCVPVGGSPFGVAATTYIDEFKSPIVRLKATFGMVVQDQIRTIAIVGLVTLLVAIVAAMSFSRRLTTPLKHLSDVADRISMGDLDASIRVQTRDEIGQLAESLRRMQISLRAAIMRLRRR